MFLLMSVSPDDRSKLLFWSSDGRPNKRTRYLTTKTELHAAALNSSIGRSDFLRHLRNCCTIPGKGEPLETKPLVKKKSLNFILFCCFCRNCLWVVKQGSNVLCQRCELPSTNTLYDYFRIESICILRLQDIKRTKLGQEAAGWFNLYSDCVLYLRLCLEPRIIQNAQCIRLQRYGANFSWHRICQQRLLGGIKP